ncbi:type IV pilus secretin PilQ [Halomonas sp. McH1-25]|uniref:type IV pilus secretin PilQ n=1 Tax=unclassified Halomonas TaxID=2609666 RepID=UPI001EF4D6C2|nr:MULTISPECIES: type IV pilus secretin PilQ [unclassified Halomonas]MCG7601430.1 type IV pilus secretin PilQ [Halomonas sp. McH1-25]MCP1341971.1 type IV pilus secretin PilQ [Halomonas sp. FL8]MCP1362894.1 type IV pilus secretin PilQ [Halomonas sp. BBD45]MCP1363893.1 type IV pilus secretin PilQ [Halomonas sp. BBD48]
MIRYVRRLLVALLGVAACSSAWAQSALNGLDFGQRADGQLEVTLHFSGEVPEVRGYRIDSPPRLAIDLMNTASRLERRRYELGLVGVNDVVALEAGGRTRLVFNLDAAIPYAIRERGDALVLSLGESAADVQASVPDATGAVPNASLDRMPSIENIDFRRGDDGASRLIVTFDRDGVDARVSEQGSDRIVADLDNVELPAALAQTLDVSDFGTPIQRITPVEDVDGTRLSIQASGDYAMLSTQSGRQLIIEVRPVSRAEREIRQREMFPYTGKRISLNFQDIEVREVLAIIAEFTGLNLVASDSVQGSVTLNLEDVPWDQALDLVLRSHGLASRKNGNVLVVAPASELASMERQELETRAQMQELAPLATEYLQVRYAKAASLAAMLRGAEGLGLLSERGRVSIDERTNTLIIQDTRERIEEIIAVVDQLDVPVRQVQIEARIVIARDSVARELGVNWGLSSNGNGKLNLGGASSGQPLSSDGQRFSQGTYAGQWQEPDATLFQRGGLAVDLGDSANPSSAFSFGYISGDILLDMELRALESEGKSQTISQPKVITANQQPAVIKQGQEIPYQEATSSGATNVEFKEAVLSLQVVPQITPDNRIIMELNINNDDVSSTEYDGAPAIDTNEIQTQVLVNDGETVVLGGILRTEQLRQLFKTPLLGDLPLLGHLFRYTEESNEKVELLVFITPKIIEDGLAIR